MPVALTASLSVRTPIFDQTIFQFQSQPSQFLAKYTPEIEREARAILKEMRRILPNAVELVYDNYNALAIGFGPNEKARDAILSIALFPRWVSLFFLQARGLDDPDGLLKGSGNTAKHIVLEGVETLRDVRVHALIDQALTKAKVPLDSSATYRLVIKSVSAKQRARRPASET